MPKVFASVALLALVLGACQAQPAGGPDTEASGYHTMDVQELNSQLANKDFLFVNVHIPFEGDIANTDLSIAYDEISRPENLAQLPSDKDSKVVLYCRSGRMSALAAADLAALGYTNIWDVEGGMLAWERAGYELQH